MQLKGENGISAELEITGYQHPGVTDEYWQSNWLIVRVAVEHPKGAWSASHPSLTTFEVDQLARWFEGLAATDPDPKAGHFTEPNLTRILRSEAICLRRATDDPRARLAEAWRPIP
jgi:hypothetical protein